MGIKPSYIKNLGTALLAKQREYFSNNFEANKQQSGFIRIHRQQACPKPRRRLHHKKNECQTTLIIPSLVYGHILSYDVKPEVLLRFRDF